MRRYFTCHLDVPSSGYELRNMWAETSFRHSQLPSNRTFRMGLRSAKCRLISNFAICLVLVSRLNVTARFICFSAAVLSVPSLHDTCGSRFVVRYRRDLWSACVSFIRVRGATATACPAYISDPLTGLVMDRSLSFFCLRTLSSDDRPQFLDHLSRC